MVVPHKRACAFVFDSSRLSFVLIGFDSLLRTYGPSFLLLPWVIGKRCWTKGGVSFALIAQLEEHHFPKVGVAGSSPAECNPQGDKWKFEGYFLVSLTPQYKTYQCPL